MKSVVTLNAYVAAHKNKQSKTGYSKPDFPRVCVINVPDIVLLKYAEQRAETVIFNVTLSLNSWRQTY